ncbi:MAG: GGDEF domain-containing protein [Rubellimicrobium sp.]|nr:GGDEF domain-containing protein [Rubellimicrobium sp.]
MLAVILLADRRSRGRAGAAWRDGVTGLAGRDALIAELDRSIVMSRFGRDTAAFVIEIDGFRLLEERHYQAVIERLVLTTGHRLGAVLRDSDLVGRIGGSTFAVALAPVRRFDLDAAIVLAGRMQRALSHPIMVNGTNIYLTVSIGFSLAARLEAPRGEDLLHAATLAMIEAQRNGPSGLRSYSQAMRNRITARNTLADQVGGALERGEITAFYQPQISSRTGEITGFETLARWCHPERGLIPPIEFLPACEQAGVMDRLGEAMIHDALGALRLWEDRGIRIPRVAVNFSNHELCDPRLVDRIGFELDRFDLTPDRLVIEVLETVVARRTDDAVMRNLSGLALLGCRLDLDDFGTGHASITSIRRFLIERIKIDRSFVTRINADAEQQKMVSAILTMAENLDLDTLAEGVETEEERAMLIQLGCGHLQGFCIARPMPLAEATDWIVKHQARQHPPEAVRLRVI